MDVFLFVAGISSRGHLSSALKHGLTKDFVTGMHQCFLINDVPNFAPQSSLYYGFVAHNHIYLISFCVEK